MTGDADIAPARPRIGGPFELVDHDRRVVTDRSWHGRPVLLLFGFTHCKVVCPRSLRKLSAVLDALGEAADALAALYVTVDPERDDPDALRDYLRQYPRFTGLTGSRQQIDAVRDAYRVYARRSAADDDGSYAVAHTSLAYLLDAAGDCTDHVPLALDDGELRERLRAALAPGRPSQPA